MTPTEILTLAPLAALIVVFGLFPGLVLDLIRGLGRERPRATSPRQRPIDDRAADRADRDRAADPVRRRPAIWVARIDLSAAARASDAAAAGARWAPPEAAS